MPPVMVAERVGYDPFLSVIGAHAKLTAGKKMAQAAASLISIRRVMAQEKIRIGNTQHKFIVVLPEIQARLKSKILIL